MTATACPGLPDPESRRLALPYFRTAAESTSAGLEILKSRGFQNVNDWQVLFLLQTIIYRLERGQGA